jgi:hypothetical protein
VVEFDSVSIRLQTREGYSILVDPDSKTCRVFRDEQMETPRGALDRSGDQVIPFVLFIGKRFEISLRLGEYILARSRGKRIFLPYRMSPDLSQRNLSFTITSTADQFPVFLGCYESVRLLQRAEGESGKIDYGFIVLDSGVTGYEKVVLKIRYPHAMMIIIKPEEPEEVRLPLSPIEEERRGGELSANPVFQARIFLRKMELDKLKQMLIEYRMNDQEIQIIRTFIQIMLQNEEKRADIEHARKALVKLRELFRLNLIISSEDKSLFEAELDKGLSPDVAVDLIPIVERLRNQAANKEDEIRYWEWEYRISKMTGMG